MRKVLAIATAWLILGAVQVSAQIIHLLQYDPYYVLPSKTGAKGVDLGLSTIEISSIGDAADIYLMGKYSASDRIEAGIRFTFGFLNDARNTFSSLTLGGKYGLKEHSAVIANLLAPAGDADDPGLSLGYMHSLKLGSGITANNLLAIGLLDGYTGGAGIALHLFLEPYKELGEKMVFYLDVPINANTDNIGDTLNIDLAPNVDYILAEGMALNAGIGLNAYNGIKRSSDLGVTVTFIKSME
jgi:hypothetical protein